MRKRTLLLAVIAIAFVLAITLCACHDTGDVPTISVATAYGKAVDLGYSGTLDDFIALISGKDGKDGKDGIDGKDGVDGTNGINGKDGKDGLNGTNGKDGKNGIDGIDGINGQDGKDGRGITNVAVIDGYLAISFSDGKTVNAGSVRCVHSYGSWQTGSVATCTSLGYDTRVCAKCGDVDYRFSEQLGHDYGNAVTVVNPTCMSGLQILTCSRCGDTQSQTIEALGHTIDYPDYTCKYCGKSTNDLYLEENFKFFLTDDGSAYEIRGNNRYVSGELIIPSEYNGLPVTKIDQNGFGYYRNITRIVIPESVTEIGSYAFSRCTSLKTIVIPSTVTVIETSAFGGVDFDSVQIDPDNQYYSGNGSCIVDKATKTLLFGNSTCSIPDDGSVEIIGSRAFYSFDNMGNIVVPEGVQTIDSYAFRNCKKVTSLMLPSTVTKIGSSAFDFVITESIIVNPANTVYKSDGNCLIEIESKKLTKGFNNSVIPDDGSVEIIDEYAFEHCGITEIAVPEGIRAIYAHAFAYASLDKISLPDTLQYIGDQAFYYTPYYKNSDNWQDGALYIGKYLIDVNSSLSEEYTVREGTLGIACNAFENSKITNLVIADSVKYIGVSAFRSCKSLTDVTIGTDAIVIAAFAFKNCDALERITFRDPASWGRYTSISEYEPISQEDMSNPEKAAEWLKITALYVEHAPDGYVISISYYGYVWYKSSATDNLDF